MFWEQLWAWSRDLVEQKERRELKNKKNQFYAQKHRAFRRYGGSYNYRRAARFSSNSENQENVDGQQINSNQKMDES